MVKLVQFGAYTAATRKDAADLPKLEVKVKADVELAEIARTEIEQLDSAIIADAEAFTSFVARSHGTSMTALLDAHYIDLAVKTAIAAKATREIINADFDDLDTLQKREGAYRQVARAQVEVSRQLTSYDLGSKPEDYATFLHMNVINDFILATAKGGAVSTESVRELATRIGGYALGGLGLVKDHVFLGQNVTKGKFSKDTDFDFSEVYGVTAHKEALFIALNGLTTRATVDTNSGNDILITKFNLYKKAIRPELVRVFRTVASA
ncbi:hypothetical protein [Herbiconiux daphne]|uniref:Uncharacterized protein n=1 Tax=Herbiconiux daphne TaxID=2970914 RepID=A0ABT2H8Z7_9MICO|nr:hypothetical protein [Herbiconiux daphne]MCS5736415.1 hypothetical protein [Herbiconiux daphne]